MTSDKKNNKLNVRDEAAWCLLCHDGPCSAACPKGLDPARFVRAVRFDRPGSSLNFLEGCSCGDKAACEKACIHFDYPVRITAMRDSLAVKPEGSERFVSLGGSVDLSIDFCGVRCENPFFLSSSVVASGYEMCANAFRMGWAGIVYKTVGVFTPDEISPRFDAVGKEGTPFIGFRNLEQISDRPLAENLAVLKKLKTDFPTKIIVASIMGQTDAEWEQLARLVTEAGSDIIECNFSCPHMTGESLGSDVGQNPELVARYVTAVKKGTHLPILAKMTPNLGNMEIPAIAAVEAGADGIAAINTIKSITGLDLETLAAPPSVNRKSSVSGYSGKAVKPIALRFIHDMAKHPALKGVPLSGMGGIETWKDAAEFMLLGCANLQVTTAVMQYGYRIIDDLIGGMADYMSAKGLSRVDELVGSALGGMVGADELDRSTIIYPLFDRDACIGCGRCHIACMDGGHQAIEWTSDRTPKFVAKKCVGCHLCLYVCPHGAIHPGKRVPKPTHGYSH